METESKQSKGGHARAKSMSPEQKSEAASNAAKARWSRKLSRATHEGVIRIGEIELACANLEDGTRVLSERGFLAGLGIKFGGQLAQARKDDGGAAPLPLFVGHKSLRPFISEDLAALLRSPIRYTSRGLSVAHGVKAELIPEVCEVWLKARDANALNSSQVSIAMRADILIRGLARVGIVALVDEATGFQYDRQREALQDLLKEYLSTELRQWVKTFPASYFREMCRLRGQTYRPDLQLPRYFGHLTNNVVYKRLGPGVLDALQEKNPSDGERRKARHHQWLSEDVGHPKLLQHVGLVVGLMKVSNDWDAFQKHLDIAAPVWDGKTMFDQLDD